MEEEWLGANRKEGLPGTQARGVGEQHTGSEARSPPTGKWGPAWRAWGTVPRSADGGLHTRAVQESLAAGMRVWVVFNLSEPQSLPL